MANEADAELVISADDSQFTRALSRMAAQTRALGRSVGADGKVIDRAVSGVTKSLYTMGEAAGDKGAAGGIRTNARAIASAKAQLAGYRAEVVRLSRAAGAVPSATSFSGFRDASGKGLSVADMKAYDAALQNVADTERKLQAIRNQGRTPGSMTPAMPVGYSAFEAKQIAANQAATMGWANAMSAAARARNEAAAAATKPWWPPAALKSTEAFTKSLMEAQNATRYVMYDVARNFALAGAAITAFGVVSVVAAARWQAAFANVQRTSGESGAALERIRTSLVAMSQDIPVSFTALTEIASLGAQMGIGASGIVAYTDVIAKLTATTNLTADAAGKALGRFKAFFAEADDPTLAVTAQTFSNLASSILKVGVNSVATESGIVNVATQISSMGSYAGFTADQVIGLSGALSSIGVPPELSRGVITRLFNTIGEAVAENGTKLQDFAKLAGVSATEFAASWGTDQFAFTFTDLIGGLNGVTQSGGDAVSVLHEIGINSVRDVPVLLRLASAAGEAGTSGSLLAQTMNDARSGWRDNIELQLQYSIISQTVSARAKVLLQNFEALFATMGKATLGPIKGMLDGLIGLVKGMTMIMDLPIVNAIAGVGTILTIAFGAIVLLTAGFVRASAAALGFAQTLTHMQVPLATATALTNVLRFALLGLGVIGVISLIAGFVAMGVAAGDANNAVQDTAGALAALREDTERGGGGFFKFTDGLSGARTGARELTTQADNLGKVLGHTTDKLYGNTSATKENAKATEQSALVYGKSAASMARSAVTQQQAFTDLFDADFGTNFADKLVEGNFDLDKALRIAAEGDKAAVHKYLTGIFGEFADEQTLPWNINPDQVMGRELHNRMVTLESILTQTGAGWQAVATSAYATGDAFRKVASDASQLVDDSFMDDFQIQNQEAINGIAKGYNDFVDSGTLINFAQQMNEAYRTIDDGTTDVDEHAEAVAGFESAWADAYGGAAFSIGEYMTVFTRAGEEQTKFIENIQTLFARGLDPAIIGDLAEMGPQAAQLVQALVTSTDAELQNYEALYQQTGFDAMVGLAAGQLAAQQIVRNAAKYLSTVQLQELSASLAAGTPLTDAMAKWNLDAQGKPMSAPAKAEMDYYADQKRLQQNAARLGFSIPVTPYLTKTRFELTGGGGVGGSFGAIAYDSGGYTGAGGMYDVRGVVHAGEYIHPKRDVDQNTGQPKPEAMLRMLRGGRAARGGGGPGFAEGGYAGSGGNEMIVHLSAVDRQLLAAAGNIRLSIDGKDVADATAAANFVSAKRGSS